MDATGVLGITTRPRGWDSLPGDIERLANGGVDILVSLLTSDEQVDLGLEAEGALCRVNGIEFLPFAIADFSVPEDTSAFLDVVARLAGAVRQGEAVAIHCRGSIGRSGLLAVAVTIVLGQSLESALDAVSTARGVPVPEAPAQREWLRHNVTRLSGLLDPVT